MKNVVCDISRNLKTKISRYNCFFNLFMTLLYFIYLFYKFTPIGF